MLDPTLVVEPWQVEDYRSMPLDTIFEKLENNDIHFDRSSFQAFADTVDSPEDLTEVVMGDSTSDTKIQDQIYLLVFELWRRLLPEKPSLSIFCDELDQQIHLYDRREVGNDEGIQDILANLQVILDENVDQGTEPHEAFECIEGGCANDIESFLYDFIAEQIDEENFAYANELLDGFSGYIHDTKWFEFLRARLLAVTDPEEANVLVKQLVKNEGGQRDLAFNFELLSFLVRAGDRETFENLAKLSARLLEVEEDFQNLVSLSADFYHRLDHERIEQDLQVILNKRANKNLDADFKTNDAGLAEFLKILA